LSGEEGKWEMGDGRWEMGDERKNGKEKNERKKGDGLLKERETKWGTRPDRRELDPAARH
jgi:hypothetical protein